MSTKVYNAYRIPAISLNELHQKLNELRSLAHDLLDQMRQKEIVRMAVFKYDAIALGQREKETGFSYIKWASFDMDERFREIKKSGRRDPISDFEFGLTFIPFEDHIYFMLFTEKDEYVELFKQHMDAELFHYWNNSDPDEDVSDEDWEERGRIWDAVLGDVGIPARVGYSFDLVGDYLEHMGDFDPEPYIADIGKRIERFSKELAADRLMDNTGKDSAHSMMSEYFKVIKTDEFKELLPQVELEVKEQLKHPLTAEDLKTVM